MEKGRRLPEGHLEELWAKVGGRDVLAAKTKILGQTLSGYNTTRLALGATNAKKIADALEISVAEVYGGSDEPPEFSTSMLGQLVMLLERDPERARTDLAAQISALAAALEELAGRLRRLTDGRSASSRGG